MRILFRQILPQALYVIVVPAAFLLARAIVAEAALSMLGVGVVEPTASWGNVLALAPAHLWSAWWLALFPGCCLFLALTLCNRAGEALTGARGESGR
jgi:peptide/nickel transport system permease protein